jgi:hypothetical protein
MHCPFTGPKRFCTGPNWFGKVQIILKKSKNEKIQGKDVSIAHMW